MPPPKDPLVPDFTLLGLLLQHPMHGYELHQRFQQAPLADIWTLSLSQLYTALKRMEENGWVEARLEWDDQSHPPRKVYRPTPDGTTAFQVWLLEPVASIREMRVNFLCKLYFAALRGPETASKLLTRQEAMCRSQLARLQERHGDSGGSINSVSQLVLDFRTGQIEAILRWLHRCRTALVSGYLLANETDNTPLHSL